MAAGLQGHLLLKLFTGRLLLRRRSFRKGCLARVLPSLLLLPYCEFTDYPVEISHLEGLVKNVVCSVILEIADVFVPCVYSESDEQAFVAFVPKKPVGNTTITTSVIGSQQESPVFVG